MLDVTIKTTILDPEEDIDLVANIIAARVREALEDTGFPLADTGLTTVVRPRGSKAHVSAKPAAV